LPAAQPLLLTSAPLLLTTHLCFLLRNAKAKDAKAKDAKAKEARVTTFVRSLTTFALAPLLLATGRKAQKAKGVGRLKTQGRQPLLLTTGRKAQKAKGEATFAFGYSQQQQLAE
jgi:hypothetical protein